MTPAFAVRDPSRQAALMLHAMAVPDREWLVAHLPPAGQDRMQELLAELQALGIPADAGLLRQLTAPAPAAVEASPAERLERLAPDRLPQLAELLATEPPQLAARLLGLQAWRWRQPLLQLWDPDLRRQVESAPRGGVAPALDRALCQAVCCRLEALATGAAGAAPTAWTVCRAWLQSWRRLP